ncbi:chemosensory receptor B [Elysia marginata]|uniref:Chemosensory receptor B n=1 Tax=Elysia marginata TaxID=1093978 RepID=A0AAV4EGW4_9GAST|nr:chemosensory receptor B [Elysia marginata]
MLTVILYHVIFVIVVYTDTGPPYNAFPQKLNFYYFSLYVIPSTTCFFIVLLSTIFLVVKVRRNQRWRKGTSTQTAKTNDKEDKLVRTIIAISTIFIICSFPTVSIFITQIIHKQFRYRDPYLGTLLLLMFNIGGVFQAISSSVNIFFYYRMSSRFKKVFASLFACRRSGIQGTKPSD